jgi:hypothetical protein
MLIGFTYQQLPTASQHFAVVVHDGIAAPHQVLTVYVQVLVLVGGAEVVVEVVIVVAGGVVVVVVYLCQYYTPMINTTAKVYVL